MPHTPDENYMQLAVEEALKALGKGEVPVGCVIVDENGVVIGRGHNLRETTYDATAHAEVVAIREAARGLQKWRLSGSTLYVTVEPCVMCMGAIVLARIERVVFGARDTKAGALVSKYSIGTDGKLNHRVQFTEGVLAEECANLLSGFFSNLRGGKA